VYNVFGDGTCTDEEKQAAIKEHKRWGERLSPEIIDIESDMTEYDEVPARGIRQPL